MKKHDLLEAAKLLLEEQPNELAVLSNASAFIHDTIDQLNWAGFYLWDGKQLTVGPFQGRVACSTIPLGKGVCGEAALNKQTLVIKDVHNHENHIACDANSRSEVVVPIFIKNRLYGVLDIDAPIVDRFNDELVDFFEHFVELLVKVIDK
ncbi:MAG: GAF domain-containing protein [Acholeplasmataceae bacterium]|jgi:GAF domain-containing protein|nr:GAF domain-containing protein [Acholeplasmataceae bacterium]